MGKLVSKLNSKKRPTFDSSADETFQTNLIRHSKASLFEETYREGKLLGEGITGSVREVEHIPSGKKFAMKTINLSKIDKAQLKELRTEIEILRQLDHPNIVKLHEVFQDEKTNTLKVIMELLTGGDLSKRVLETEEEIQRVVYQVVSATRYFHARGVVHRDLKLENVLYSNESPESDVKVIDFGLGARFYSDQVLTERKRMEERRGLSSPVEPQSAASLASPGRARESSEPKRASSPRRSSDGKHKSGKYVLTPSKKKIKQSRLFLTTCGTAFYMPPEMFNSKGYDAEKVDTWAIGVLTYVLITKRPPFQGKNEKEIFERAKYPPSYVGPYWEKMSPEALRFVQNCLSINPDLRYSAERALASAWLRPMRHSLIKRRASACLDFDMCVIQSMLRYATYSMLRKAALMVMAHNYSNFQNGLLNSCFLEIDKDKQGYITYEEFSDFVKSRDAAIPQDEIAKAFRAIDLDRTGVVRYMEFLAASLEMEYPITEKMADVAFDHLKDETGFITTKSMRKLLGDGFSKEEIDVIIAEADLEGDRRVSRKEFNQLLCEKDSCPAVPGSPRAADDKFFRNVIGEPPARNGQELKSPSSNSIADTDLSRDVYYSAAESDDEELVLQLPVKIRSPPCSPPAPAPALSSSNDDTSLDAIDEKPSQDSVPGFAAMSTSLNSSMSSDSSYADDDVGPSTDSSRKDSGGSRTDFDDSGEDDDGDDRGMTETEEHPEDPAPEQAIEVFEEASASSLGRLERSALDVAEQDEIRRLRNSF